MRAALLEPVLYANRLARYSVYGLCCDARGAHFLWMAHEAMREDQSPSQRAMFPPFGFGSFLVTPDRDAALVSSMIGMVHSLEPEYLELKAAGAMDESATLRAVALERGEIFSVFEEIRFALYGAVAAITAGVGILVKQNLDKIGPLTLIIILATAAVACYTTAIRTRSRKAARSIGGDYLLLLGALIMSADLGYMESQFHWLGSHWSWYLLILTALHAATAYTLDSRLVLSVSLTSLAGWFGVTGHIAGLIQLNGAPHNSGIDAIACAGAILLWQAIHVRLNGPSQFIDAFEHFAANLGFWGALVLCGGSSTRIVAITVLIVLAAVSITRGLRSRKEVFVIYGIGYAALGLCIVEAQTVSAAVIAVTLALGTVLAALILLWQLHQRVKKVAP